MNINEGFNADINSDDNDSKDEMEIEAPNEGNNIIYVVDGDEVTTKKEKIVNKDDDKNTIDSTYSDIEKIEDIKLKKDVINAVNAINDIKERERSNEIFRLTGGDDTNIKKEIIEIFDNPNSKKIRRKQTSENGETIEYSLFKIIQDSDDNFWDKKGSYYYLNLSELNDEYDIKDMYSKIIKTVGKGEYLLPLLYHDVYKQQVYGYNKYDLDTFSIGDNFILRNENGKDEKYHLELKAPNAPLTFKSDDLDIIKSENGVEKYNKKTENDYKKIIASSFIKYAKRQNKNRKKLYMCIFNEDNNGNPLGILFINISNIEDNDLDLLTTFTNLIYIDATDTSSKKDFKYTVIVDENKPRIKCNLHKSYLSDDINSNIQKIRRDKRIEKKTQKTVNNESKILSRDNFVNEIYIK